MKIAVVFGTRPEAIKLAPVILALKKNKRFKCRVIVTAQHRHMLDQVLEVFNIKPDIDLNLMEKNQTLAGFAAKALTALDKCFKKEKPDMILVQGDTTTTWAASLAAFYNRIRVGHVEAGLRTGNRFSPFPEEINRILTTHLADLHFAPTKWAAQNLIKEGIPKSKIFITGNTVIDALHFALKKVRSPNFNPYIFIYSSRRLPSSAKRSLPAKGSLPIQRIINRFVLITGHRRENKQNNSSPLMGEGKGEGEIKPMPFILITGHRRENFGQGFRNICLAIKSLAKKFPDHYFVYPVHLNPNVRKHVMKILKGERNIILTDPVDYLTFVWLMDNCKLILTDSGGIQEEAPSLGKPVLVMRDTTERPEVIWAGTAKLVGTNPKVIINSVTKLLNNYSLSKPDRLKRPEKQNRLSNVFGDGTAAKKIVSKLK